MILINGKVIEHSIFPNQEVILKRFDKVTYESFLEWRPSGDDIHKELFIIAALVMHIRRVTNSMVYVHLRISCMPYQQMDRDNAHYIKTLPVICKMINDMGFNSVKVVDPHSPVVTASLNNALAVTVIPHLLKELQLTYKSLKNPIVAFADGSATTTYGPMLEVEPESYIEFIKHRDFETGKIVNMTMLGGDDVKIKGSDVILIDDLIMGGRTIFNAAKMLKEHGAKRIFVIAPHIHGMFTCKPMPNTLTKVYGMNTLTKNMPRSKKIKLFDSGRPIWKTV